MTKRRKIMDVRKALEKLGFVSKTGRSKHHKFKFVYFDEDRKKQLSVPVPKGRSELPIGTLDAIRDRMYLDIKRFNLAIECPFKKDDYQAYLKDLMEKDKL